MRRFILAAVMPLILLACSSSSQSVSVGQASVDPTHTCPTGSNDAAYDINATVAIHNPTSKAVTINSVTADMTLKATAGAWAEKVGDKYDAGAAKFTPSTVPAGATGTIDVTVKSECTNGETAVGGTSHGDYQVALHIDTSAGNFTSTSSGLHRIVAA